MRPPPERKRLLKPAVRIRPLSSFHLAEAERAPGLSRRLTFFYELIPKPSMGNSPIPPSNQPFNQSTATQFLILDKDKKLGFFNRIVRKRQCTAPDNDNNPIKKGSQIFEVSTELNWFVLGPLILTGVLLLAVILYYSTRHHQQGFPQ